MAQHTARVRLEEESRRGVPPHTTATQEHLLRQRGERREDVTQCLLGRTKTPLKLSDQTVTFESTTVLICFASNRSSKDLRHRPALPALVLLGREERSAILC